MSLVCHGCLTIGPEESAVVDHRAVDCSGRTWRSRPGGQYAGSDQWHPVPQSHRSFVADAARRVPVLGYGDYYYRRFRLDGSWQRIHDMLREKVRRQTGKKPTPSAAIIGSQTIKTDAPKMEARTATTRARKPSAESGI